jgi:scyllo-inositol 2-dehydrogenase (NADP+)
MSASRVSVGIVGLGRSGWNIHALTLQKLADRYQVVAVADPDEARRQEAEQALGCRAYAAAPQLFADPAVELVVVASPSHLHAMHTVQALEAGKAVLCEKPMAATLSDADSMIAAAERTGGLLTVFQSRRYEPSYLKVKELMASGNLGRITEIKMTSHSFGRRWDWQTIKAFGGGQMRNNVVHLLDMALQIIGPSQPQVFCHTDRALALGDAEDSVKLILLPAGGPLVDIELLSNCAYPQEFWLVAGTQGSLAGSSEQLRWKYFRADELPGRRVSTEPTPDRSYNRDEIKFYEAHWELSSETPTFEAYYLDLFHTLREGAPLPVTPASVRRVMEIIDQCR